MAKLDEMVAAEGREGTDLGWIKALLWQWFEQNADAEVLTVHFWIFSKTIRLRDARHIFELLLGSEPTSAVA